MLKKFFKKLSKKLSCTAKIMVAIATCINSVVEALKPQEPQAVRR